MITIVFERFLTRSSLWNPGRPTIVDFDFTPATVRSRIESIEAEAKALEDTTRADAMKWP